MSLVAAPTSERFGRFVASRGPDECWPWLGRIDRRGYGVFSVWVARGRRRTAKSHRVAYELAVGPIPDGLDLDHTCHTKSLACPGGPSCIHRRCVNPAHLEPVTPYENLLRGESFAAVNARKTHCIHGHELTPENTRLSIYCGRPERKCRQCIRRRKAEARRRASASVSPTPGADAPMSSGPASPKRLTGDGPGRATHTPGPLTHLSTNERTTMPSAEEIVRQQCAASLKLVEAAAATCRSGLGPVRARPTLYDWSRERCTGASDCDAATHIHGCYADRPCEHADECDPHGIPRPMRVVPS